MKSGGPASREALRASDTMQASESHGARAPQGRNSERTRSMAVPQRPLRADRPQGTGRDPQQPAPRGRSNKLSGPQLVFLLVTPAVLVVATIIVKLNKSEPPPQEVKIEAPQEDPNQDVDAFRQRFKDGKLLCSAAHKANQEEAPDFKEKHKKAFATCEDLQQELDRVVANHTDKQTNELIPQLRGLRDYGAELQQMRVDLLKIAPTGE